MQLVCSWYQEAQNCLYLWPRIAWSYPLKHGAPLQVLLQQVIYRELYIKSRKGYRDLGHEGRIGGVGAGWITRLKPAKLLEGNIRPSK